MQHKYASHTTLFTPHALHAKRYTHPQLVVSIIFEAFQFARLESIGSAKDEEDRKTEVFLKGLEKYVLLLVIVLLTVAS